MKKIKIYLLILLFGTLRGAPLKAEKFNLDNYILSAAENGELKTVKWLIESGVNVNTKNAYGYTPLHLAAINGHKDVVEYLLTVKNININALSESKSTPLHMAMLMGHDEIAEILISKGARTDIKRGGKSPVDYYRENGNSRMVEFLEGPHQEASPAAILSVNS